MYEARYGFTPLVVIVPPVLLGLAGWFGWALVKVTREQGPHPAFLLLIGGTGLMLVALATSWLVAAATHRPAVRFDRHGVTLGREPAPPSRRVFVPWEDIDAIVIFRRSANVQGIRLPTTYLGLRLTRDADRPPGVLRRGSRWARISGWPVDVGRAIKGWELDRTELAGILYRYAAHIRVDDRT